MNCARCGAPVTAGQVCAHCGTPAPQGAPGGYRPPVAPASDFGYGSPYMSYAPVSAPQIPTPAGLSLPEAVKEVLTKYATFQGRATRPEFWWWLLAFWLAVGLPWLIAVMIAGATDTSLEESPIAGLLGIYTLVLVLGAVVPSIAVSVRRMHDIGQSGWLYLVNFLPTLGGILFLVLCGLPSKPFGNQYGLAPPRQHGAGRL